MILLERNRLNVDVVAHDIGCQDLSLSIVDDASWRIEGFCLDVFIIGSFCQFSTLNDLPVIETTQQSSHAQAHKQEDEHLAIACSTEFCAHLVPPFACSRL